MKRPKISIVIPAYNASSTIDRCLDSLYGLPLEEPDFEVVVVDDCSQDIPIWSCFANQKTIV